MFRKLIKFTGLAVLAFLTSCGGDIDESPPNIILVSEDAGIDVNSTPNNSTDPGSTSDSVATNQSVGVPVPLPDPDETSGTDPATVNATDAETSTSSSGIDALGTDPAGTASAGNDTAGTSTAGNDTAGTATTGDDTAGSATAGNDTAGSATAGDNTAGTDTSGNNGTGELDTAGVTTAGADSVGTTTDAGSDSTGLTTDAGNTGGSDTDAGAVDAGSTTAGSQYPAGSLASVVEAHGKLGMALDALKAAGLDLALNDPQNQWTVFLPTDAAMVSGSVFDVQKHIHINAAIPAVDLLAYDDQPLFMNDGESLFFGEGYDQFVTLAGSDVAGSELFGNTSSTIVHVIDSVIGKNSTPEDEYPTGIPVITHPTQNQEFDGNIKWDDNLVPAESWWINIGVQPDGVEENDGGAHFYTSRRIDVLDEEHFTSILNPTPYPVTMYITLWYLIGDTWYSTASPPIQSRGSMQIEDNGPQYFDVVTIGGGSEFRDSNEVYGSNPVFTLTDPGNGAVANWQVYVGSTVGDADIFDSGNVPASNNELKSVDVEASNLPIDGSTVFLTTWYQLVDETNWHRQTFELASKPVPLK